MFRAGMHDEFRIDIMQPGDWHVVREIYLDGIATGNATFETDAPDWDAWDRAHLSSCRLVARTDRIVGWAALSPVSPRDVYAGVAEVSVYVALGEHGKGIGRALLQRLIEGSEHEKIWTLQAGIFPENVASIELHKRCGFSEVGRRKKIGKLGDAWRDVVLMERRSEVVGL